MENAGMLDWRGLGRDDFERLVEVLIVRKHARDAGARVVPFDGRGGDGGVDVGVWRGDVLDVVYQLKYFLDGFPASNSSRRRQIRSSFDRAKAHAPKRWVLVIPGNVTPGELKFVQSLGSNAHVIIETPMGRAALDSELARWEDVHSAFTRNRLLETLRTLSLEGVALATAADLARAARDLGRRASGMSAYWSQVVLVDGDRLIRSVRPKHPRAAELEPLRIELDLDERFLDPSTASAFGDLVRYGIGGLIALPAAAVTSVRFIGPDWFAAQHTNVGVRVGPVHGQRAGKREIEFRHVDADGITLSSWRGRMSGRMGTDGGHMTAVFSGGLTVTLRLPREPTVGRTFEVSHEAAGERPVDVLEAFALIRHLKDGSLFQLLVDGEPLAEFAAGADGYRYPGFAYLEQLADDLAVLEREFGLSLRIPVSITDQERWIYRILRLVLEGRCVEFPLLQSLTANLSADAGEQAEQFLRGDDGWLNAEGDSVFEIQGNRVRTDGFNILVKRPRVTNASEALDAISRGQARGFPITVESASAAPFRVYMASRWADPDAPLAAEPPGIVDDR